MKSIIKVVFVIIATLVGAGFASGKEIHSFFLIYGAKGILGICVSSFLISAVVYKVLKICDVNGIRDYQEFCNYIIGKNVVFRKFRVEEKVSVALNKLVNVLLLLTFFIMVAGFSSFLKQEFNIDKFCGSIIIVILCYITFQKNVDGLIKISNYLVPILIIFLLSVSAKNLEVVDNYYSLCGMFNNESGFKAVLQAILYGSYNCILLIPVLITLKQLIEKPKKIWSISVVSFILITILSLSIYNILLLGNLKIFALEMPIIEIIKRYGDIYLYSYLFMIGVSIFTTAISTGFGFLNGVSKSVVKFKRNSILICVGAVFLSQISFSVMVKLLYPILGIIGLSEIMLLI